MNFTDKVGVGGGQPSTNLHLIEKFTRTAADTIRYEFTVDDPDTYRKVDGRARPDVEARLRDLRIRLPRGNYGLRNMLSASRTDDRSRGDCKVRCLPQSPRVGPTFRSGASDLIIAP